MNVLFKILITALALPCFQYYDGKNITFPLISAVDMKPFKINITFNSELTLFMRFFALEENKYCFPCLHHYFRLNCLKMMMYKALQLTPQ